MQRRKMLAGLGAIASAAAMRTAQAESQAPHVHGAGAHQTLASAAGECVIKGEACLTHCYELLAQGDKTMASCAKSAREMLAICNALRSVAAQEAPSLARLAGVAQDVCNRCQTECRKHEKTHSACKECGDACGACAAECKKVASA